MNRYFCLIALSLLYACSSKDKCQNQPDTDTYVSSAKINEKVHKLIFTTQISQSDVAALNKLAKDFKLNKIGRISLYPYGFSGDSTNNLKKACVQVKKIFLNQKIRESAVDIQPIKVDNYGKQNIIVIKSYRYDLLLPTADKWKYDIGDIDPTKDIPNFGTAAEYNLGCMIANPRDLVDPAEIAEVDGKSAVTAVRKVIPVAGRTGGGTGGTGNNSGIDAGGATVSGGSTTK